MRTTSNVLRLKFPQKTFSLKPILFGLKVEEGHVLRKCQSLQCRHCTLGFLHGHSLTAANTCAFKLPKVGLERCPDFPDGTGPRKAN